MNQQPANGLVPVVLGVMGSNTAVAGSLSPHMFAAAFAELELGHAYYVPLPIRESAPGKAMRSLARMGMRGANVTTPFKEVAAAVASIRSEAVERSGVANTLVVERGGRLRAEATDGAAVVAALADAGVGLQDSSIDVVGAGGAAREIACALAAGGASRIRICNRSRARAVDLQQHLQSTFPALELQLVASLPIDEPADVIVSAVPAEAARLSNVENIGSGPVLVDLAYRQDRRPTELVETARHAGMRVVDGLEILVRQGALAFRHWFGFEPPREVMQRAVA